jgi:hypothetical protein
VTKLRIEQKAKLRKAQICPASKSGNLVTALKHRRQILTTSTGGNSLSSQGPDRPHIRARVRTQLVAIEEDSSAQYGGFTRWGNIGYKAGQDLLLVIHCLYLSAYIITYVARDWSEIPNELFAGILIGLTPLPVCFSMVFLAPGMTAR